MAPWGRVSNPEPSALTQACPVGAALLPWFSLPSGTYRLYPYVLLAATLLAGWPLIPAIAWAAALAELLLVVPAEAVYPAGRFRPWGGPAG